jgi:hypothetical protein
LFAWPIAVTVGEGGLKFYALLLQLGGGWIATSVIRQNLQIFQAGGLKAAILGWWGRRPVTRHGTAYLQGGSATASGGFARLRLKAERSPGDSIELQLDKLWQSQQQLWSEVDHNRSELEGKLGATHAALQEVKEAHDRRTNELTEVVKRVAASSPLYAYYGAWMAAVGTVLSTYAVEFAKALQ